MSYQFNSEKNKIASLPSAGEGSSVVEVKHDYEGTIFLEVDWSWGSEEKYLRKFLEKDIEEAEEDIEYVEGHGLFNTKDHEVEPLYKKGPRIHKKRAEEALENLNDFDHVFFWGDGHIMELVSDEEGPRVRVYANKEAKGVLEKPRELKEYRRELQDLGFKTEVGKEEDISPLWYDFYNLLGSEEAKNYYGEENVRIRPKSD